MKDKNKKDKIKVTKDDVKDYLEKKLKEFEQKEQYEKCAEVLEDIKKLEKMYFK